MLHLDQVVGRYGAVTAVNDLTLTIDAGSRHAIIGPNGAGKSTLLHLIAGTLRPARGRIRLDDVDITRQRPAARARHGIGRTFQHPGLAADLTCAENVTLARRGKDSGPAGEVLARVGLAEHAHTRAGRLPYGQRRILEIAVALAANPRLLLLDEPCAGLGPADITRLAELLEQLGDTTSIVLVEHHLDLVWQLADTVTVLHHGNHLATGTPAAVRADPAVREAYLTPARPANLPADRARAGGGPALLSVQDLRAGYHGAPVLDGISLQVDRGSIHAVLGRNGAGKSTLMGALGGLLTPSSGRISLDGTTLPTTRPHQLAEHGIALVPQGRRLFATLTVREHLRLPANRRPGHVRWNDDQVMPVLIRLLDRLPAQLSGGQQQMLAIARALLAGPRLLLLDEPTEGLAPAIVDQIGNILTRLAADGMTIVFAEQNLPFALRIADQLTVLDRGRVALTTAVTGLDQPELTARLHELLGVDESTAGTVTTGRNEPTS